MLNFQKLVVFTIVQFLLSPVLSSYRNSTFSQPPNRYLRKNARIPIPNWGIDQNIVVENRKRKEGNSFGESEQKAKKLFFPEGSELTLSPELRIPFLNKGVYGIGSNLKVAFPLTIALDNLAFKPLFGDDDWFPFGTSFGRHKRSAVNSTKFSECEETSKKRLSGFKKLEGLFDSYMRGSRSDGKSCILRAICEIHEYPMGERYGLLGDFLTLFASVKRFLKRSCGREDSEMLKEYVAAERRGGKRLCQEYYHGKCDKSLFRSG